MKVSLIPIGKSKGIRIPKSVIKECGFGEQVEMRVTEGVVILSPTPAMREGWSEAFRKMAASGDDDLLLPDTLSHDSDEEEWEW